MFGTTCDLVAGIESLELSRHVSLLLCVWVETEPERERVCFGLVMGQGA